MVETNYNLTANHHGSASRPESTLLPMLIAGLVAIVVGLTVAAFFV